MSQMVWTFPGGKLLLNKDVTDDDSDKTVTVPAGKLWLVTCIVVHYVASADVGNRRMELHITDGTDMYFKTRAADTQAATEDVWYVWLPGFRDTVVATLGTFNQSFIPNLILSGGHTIRLIDIMAIATAADDMHVFILGQEIDAP